MKGDTPITRETDTGEWRIEIESNRDAWIQSDKTVPRRDWQ